MTPAAKAEKGACRRPGVLVVKRNHLRANLAQQNLNYRARVLPHARR